MVRSIERSGLLNVTFAPEMAAPLLSETVPRNEVVADCDQAKRLNKNTESTEAATLRAERIRSSLVLGFNSAAGFRFPRLQPRRTQTWMTVGCVYCSRVLNNCKQKVLSVAVMKDGR